MCTEKAIEIDPNHKESYYFRSKTYEALGEMDLSQLDMEVYNTLKGGNL